MAGAKVVECVPNFSEGRDKNVIQAIAEAMKNTDGCTLLDVDSGESTNRCNNQLDIIHHQYS